MRWKGLIALLVLAGIIFVLSLFLTDTWLEGMLERTASNAIQAKVEIDNLDISLIGLHFRWDSLQVTDPKDPWKNMLTSGKAEYDMEFYPLLYNKVVIDNVQLSHVTWGTERTTDGTWKTAKKEKDKEPGFISKTVDRLDAKVADMPALDFSSYSGKVNVDSIMALLDITAPKKIDSLQNQLNGMYSQWDQRITNTNIESDLNRIEENINSINPEEIKSVENLQSSLTTLKTIQSDIDSLQSLVKNTKSDFSTDLQMSQSGLKSIDNWISEDISQAMAKAKLPDISTQQIGILLFGKQVIGKLNRVLGISGQARKYAGKLTSDKPKKQKPPRFKGQTIHFSGKNVFPSMWIKKIELSGSKPEQYTFQGIVNDIVSQQPIIGKTTKFEITGAKERSSALSVTGELNYLKDKPEEHFKLDITNLGFKDVPLSNSPALPSSITKGKGGINAKLDLYDEKMTGGLQFKGSEIGFAFAENSGSKVAPVVKNVFDDISQVSFNADWSGTPEQTDFSLSSNLDNVVADAIKSMVGKEVEEAKAKIRKAVHSRVDAEKDKAEKLVAEKNAVLQERIDGIEARVEQYRQQVDDKKKEVEARIEEEKNKVKDKIKGLF